VFAEPMNPAMFRRDKSAKTVAAIKAIQNDKKAQISAFAHAQPTARIVDIRYADHFVFLSNQAEVLRALESFLAALPQ
jgi:pimeloyl-ACP methyl ester carboxylesterase